MIVGSPLLTVSVAALVVTLPTLLVNTASYLLPFIAAVTLLSASVADVAPLMSGKEPPPLVLTFDWTVGVGLPLAAAVKLALAPALAVWLLGCVMTTGAVLTVSVAALVVTLPTLLVNTASYSLPFMPTVTALSVSVVEVAPL